MVLLKSDSQKLQKGDRLPEFNLRNVVDEHSYSNVSFSDKKAILIIFMCNHCPYVQSKFDEIERLTKIFPDIAVIGISSNDIDTYPQDGPDNMKKVAEGIGLKYYLYDESQDVAKRFGATCTPDPFLFLDGKLVFHGRLNNAMTLEDTSTENTMELVIRDALDGKEIEPWFNPSMGCSIKWK